MTPTLSGRWQARVLLMGLVGGLITFFFAQAFGDYQTPFVLLGYVIAIGLLWDMLYAYVQTLRWDRDWPPIFFVVCAILEAIVLWGLIKGGLWAYFGLTSLPGVSPNLTLGQFVAHYSTVFLAIFLLMLGPLKLTTLYWRFRGGQWL